MLDSPSSVRLLQGILNQHIDSTSYVSLLVATVWRGPAAASSGDAAKLVPPSRWDVERGWEIEALPKRFGSFVQGAELFDDGFFALSAQEVSRGIFLLMLKPFV